MALLLKDRQSLKIIPASLFNLRKFNFSSPPMGSMNQTLLNFLNDDSYKIQFSDSLVEYLFSMIFNNYSLSGFFDHERLVISDPQLFEQFFSFARLIEAPALEKSLQIFSILLKHSQQPDALIFFNSVPIFVSLLDFLYRFGPSFRDEDDVKDQAYFFLKSTDSSLASRLDLSRQSDLHEILLYFEGHNTPWETFFTEQSPKYAVFDLTLRLIKLILDCNLKNNPCALTLSHLSLLSQVYFSQFKAYPLLLELLPLFFDKFEELIPLLKNKEPINFYLYVLHNILLSIDLSFFSSPKHLTSCWLQFLNLLQHWLSCYDSLLLSFLPLTSPELLFKKNKFKFLNSDKRFPTLPSLFESEIQFCFSDFIAKPEHPQFEASTLSFESSIESIFVYTKCLINITLKFSATIKTIKCHLPPQQTETRLQINLHLLGNLSSLNRHLELLLLLTRLSFFKRKSTKSQNLLTKAIGILSRVLYQTLAQVGRT
jgi:hypothetical protein